MNKNELVEFIQGKITDVEKSIKVREEMEKTWRGGTDASWKAAAALHPSTAGKAVTKSERLKISEIQGRIAAKLRLELNMFKAVLDVLTK